MSNELNCKTTTKLIPLSEVGFMNLRTSLSSVLRQVNDNSAVKQELIFQLPALINLSATRYSSGADWHSKIVILHSTPSIFLQIIFDLLRSLLYADFESNHLPIVFQIITHTENTKPLTQKTKIKDFKFQSIPISGNNKLSNTQFPESGFFIACQI